MINYISKLAESGLTPQDAEQLGMSYVADACTLDVAFRKCPAIKFEYFDTQGQPMPDGPCKPPYFRLRYLSDKAAQPAQTIPQKSPRYVQQRGTLPVAYFPKNQSWGHIVNNTNVPLIITEGEFKAAKACKAGFPTIGLGGVHSWRALKRGVDFLESLKQIKWYKRVVFICFDSDYRSNADVCRALVLLAEELEDRGVDVRLVTLPHLHNDDDDQAEKKVGLDDYLVGAGELANTQFMRLLKMAEPLGISRALFALNNRYVCIDHPCCVYNKQTRREISPEKFKNFIEAGEKYQELVLHKDGSAVYKKVSAASKWISWQLRDGVEELTYVPGKECRVVRHAHGREIHGYNMWAGWACAPKEGDVSLFLALIDHLFKHAPTAVRDWFLDWLAYPLQNPGAKMFTSAVLHSITQGVGKSLVGYTMKRIYGENYKELTQEALKEKFSVWAVNKQFVMGDDVTGSDNRAYADLLKNLITQEETRIHKKFIDAYEVPACINFYFTSNQPDAFFMSDTDRRFFIHACPHEALPFEFYTGRYMPWARSAECGPALFYYFLQRDLSNFDPAAPAMMTVSKEQMIDIGRSELGAWVRALLTEPDKVLCAGSVPYASDLVSSVELLAFYDPMNSKKITAQGIARELARSGCPVACGGNKAKTKSGYRRLFVLRNQDRWVRATRKDVEDYYERSCPDSTAKF